MYIYRFEYPDGAGPFCNMEGQLRSNTHHVELIQEDWFYGCKDLNQLREYFDYQQCVIKNCEIYRYDVPAEQIVFDKREVRFPRCYKENGVKINIDLFKKELSE